MFSTHLGGRFSSRGRVSFLRLFNKLTSDCQTRRAIRRNLTLPFFKEIVNDL
jgi:hypothetical protein